MFGSDKRKWFNLDEVFLEKQISGFPEKNRNE